MAGEHPAVHREHDDVLGGSSTGREPDDLTARAGANEL
jgi:hypothetical protein